jgi:hypothetical protein
MARDVTAVTSNLMLSHETSAETLLSALQKGLLISRQSLAPKRFVRGDEEGDESCEKTRCIARGEMNPAMVGFRMTGECTGFALMQFEAVTYVAHNVPVSRRAGSRPQGGEGVFTALHERPTTPPAVTSGRRPRRVRPMLCAATETADPESPLTIRSVA